MKLSALVAVSVLAMLLLQPVHSQVISSPSGPAGAAGATGATGSTGPAPSGTGVLINLTAATPSAFQAVQRQTATVTKSSSTALSTLTGISYSLAASTAYMINGALFNTQSAAGGGVYQLTFTGTTSAVSYYVTCTSPNSGSTPVFGSALNSIIDVNIAAAETAFCSLSGSFVTTNAGTLTVQFAQTTASGTSTANIGSSVAIWPII